MLAPILLALGLATLAAPAAAAPALPPPPPARAGTRSPPPPPPPPAAPNTESHRTGAWPAQPSGKKVTIAESVTLDEALEKIAAAAGWNLVASTGRLGDRTLGVVTLRDVPVEDALDAVLEGSPLVATRRGDVVTVAPGRPVVQDLPVLSGFDQPTGKRFTGDFADEAVDAALRKVADAAGLSVVFPAGLRGAVNGHFKDAPVEDVLRVLLGQAGLAAAREGSILSVTRAGAGSVVIERGKRRVLPHGVDADLGREIDQAMREAQREADRARREAGKAGARARAEADGSDEGDEAAPDAGTRRRRRGGGAQVRRGDTVVPAGERAREVVVFGGMARLEPAASAQQVTAILGSVSIGPGASVDREVVAIGGDVRLEPGAHVGADVVSIGGKIVIDEGAQVDGEQVSIDVPGLGGLLSLAGARKTWTGHAESSAWRVGRALTQFVVFFALGLFLLVLFPRRVETLTTSLGAAPGKAVLTGVLGLLAIPIAALLLVVTVIGIPFVAVLVLAIGVATVMGYTALALWFGRALPFHFSRGAAILQLAIGTAVLVAVAQIPVLGKLALVAAWLFLFGVVLRTRFGAPPSAPPPVLGTTAPPGAPPAPPMPPATRAG